MPYEFEDELQSEAVSGRFVFEDEAPSDEPSSLTDLAVSGYHNMMASGEMVDAANQAKDINDPDFAGVERRGMDKSSFLGMSSDELRRRSTAAQPDGKQRLGLELQQTLDRSQEHSNKAGNVRLSESTDRFLNSEDNDLSSIWSDFWEAPVTIVTEISAQSLAPSAASMGAGVVGGLTAGPAGFIAGSGATSARIEYANSIKERLAESGIDMTNADSFAKAYQSNPELFQEAHEYALKRGAVIGTVDAATAGLATKTLGIGEGLTKHGTNLLTQGVVQAGGGALGEAGAQLATEGEIASPRQVAAEAAGELISAPLDVAGATIAGVRDRQANLDPANASKETTQAGLDEIRQAQADALRQQHEGVSTAADLGLKMPEQRDYSDIERPTVLRNYGPTLQRGNNEILNDIGIARRMGFDEEAQALSQARELYMQAEQAKSSGREGLAQELTKQANELHMTAIDTSNRMSDTINNFPAPYVSEGEVQGGGLSIPEEQPNFTMPEDPIQGQAREVESVDNRLTQDNANKLPPGTEQINLGREYTPPESTPIDPTYDGVGENIANRQAPDGLALPNQQSVTQEQVIDQQRVNKPTVEQIDQAAAETNEQPSEAQIEADNYKKGRVKIAGLNIAIENRKGAIRSGTDSSGKKWESKMEHHYGDIKGYKGADGDDIDVFIGNNPESDQVFIVDQVDPKTGAFDEHKVMMGFNSIEEAKVGYLANYEKNWQGAGEVSALSETDFKQWLKGDTTKPYNLKVKPENNGFVYRPNGAPYKTAKGAQFNQAYRNNKGAKVVEVEGGYAIQLPDQEKIETQRANSQKKAKASYTRDPDPASDDLMNAIALGGGIRRDYAEGVDPADYSRRAAGIRLVFPKNSGKSLDEMTEYLRQFGYVQSVEELQSKLDSSLRGEEVLTPEAQMSKMDELQAELDQEHAPVVEGQTSEESFLSVAAEEARQAGVDENRIKAIIYANVDEGELAAAMELSNEIQRVQTEGLQARDGSEGGREVEAGFSEGRPTDAESVWGAEEDLLTSYSEEDLQAREADIEAERDRQSKADSKAESKAQADLEVNDFALSGSDRASDIAASRGQNDMFGASQSKSKPAKPEASLAEGQDPEIAERLDKEAEYASDRVSDLQSELDNAYEQSKDIPGWTVTGRSKRSKSLDRSLDSATNKQQAIYQRLQEAQKEETKAKNTAAAYRKGTVHENGSPKSAKKETAKVNLSYADYIKQKVSAGDQLWFLPRDSAMTVKRLNKNSITVESGVKWEYLDFAPMAEGKPMSMAEIKADMKKLSEPSEPAPSNSKIKPEDFIKEPGAKDLNDGPYTLDYHNAIFRASRDGELDVNDFKHGLDTLLKHEAEIKKRLNKYKKSILMNISGRMYFNTTDYTKPQVLEHAWDRMLGFYLLDKKPPQEGAYSFDEMNAEGMAKRKAKKKAETIELAYTNTQEDIDAWAKSFEEHKAEQAEKQKEKEKALDNPETLDDYRIFIKEKGEQALSGEQMASYDELLTRKVLDRRKADLEKKAEVAAISGDTSFETVETTHAKKGIDLFVVKLTGERLDGDRFSELRSKAKQLGGYYSGFARNGAIPGFQFESNEDRQRFVNILQGENESSLSKTEERLGKKQDARVSKLLNMAEKAEERGQAKLNQDRKTNTARRASMAASVEAQAEGEIQFARLLKEIAKATESGELEILSNLSAATQLAELNYIQNRLLWKADKSLVELESLGYRKWKKGISIDDKIKAAELSKPMMYVSVLNNAAKAMAEVSGYKQTAKSIQSRIKGMGSDSRVDLSHYKWERLLPKIKQFATRAGGSYANNGQHYAEQIREAVLSLNRLENLGITSQPMLRQALRELYKMDMRVQSPVPEKTKLQKLEKDLQMKVLNNRKLFNDFFPTPVDKAGEIVDLADIDEGMRVLEPSAGNGMLADAVKAAGGNVDAVELGSDLREILEEKGYNVIGDDFLELEASADYDRVVMNPPFSKDQDIKHVAHAYNMLKPGGRLVAIVSSTAGDRQNKNNKAFRDWIDELAADEHPLPEGSFKSSLNPTGVNTKVFVIDKPEGESVSAPMFSRTGASNSDNASVLSVDAVRASSEAIARRLRIRGVKLSVVASEDSLPDSLKAQIAADGAEGEIKAAYHNKAIHIVADRMQSKLDIEEAILHEGAHYGGRVLFGKDMHNAYRKLWMKLGGVKGLRAKAKEGGFAKDLEPYIKTAEDLISKGEISSADRARFLVDEFLAHMNQQKAHDGITRKAMRAVKEFIGAIRNMLRKYKLMELEQMSDSDLQYLLKRITESTRDQAPDADKPHFMRVSEQEQMSMMFSDMAQALGEQPMFSRTSEAFDDLNDQQEAFLDKIGPETPVQKLKHRFEQVMDNWRLKLRQQLVDRYAPLYDIDKKAKGEDVIEESIQDSSWVLARMAQSADGALNAMLNHGRIKYKEGVIDVQDNSVGLLDTLQKLGNAAEVERFMGWIAANRAEKLMEEGRENLFSNEEIAAGIRLNEGVAENGLGRAQLYDDVFAEFQAYRDDVLKIAMDSGIISEENYSMWKDEFYVPFYRAMEDEEIKGPVAGGGLSRQQAYKKLKGGDQNLNDLLGNTLMNFNHLVTSSLKNAAASKALENAEEIGAAAEVNESARDKKQSTFVLREGEKVYYDIADPLVYRSLISMTESAIKFPGMGLMRSFKRVFTNFTTASPQFIAANLIRDSLQAAATSEVSANVPKNVLKGMKDYGVFDKTTRTRAKMLASGGAFSFGHVYGDDADAIKIRLNGELRKAQVLKDPAKALGILRKAWDKYQDVSDSFENVNRAAIFEQNQDRGQLYASFKARDLMDFSQRGMNPVVTFLIDTVPFLNARIQGLDKLYRSGAKPTARVLRGKATDADKQAAARFAAVTGALTMATIALYLHNRDDEDYRDLEDWQKDTYWFFKVGDDAFFIPKPFEVGAIATLAERAVEQMVDDSADADLFLERMGHMVSDTFSFNPIPQIFRPVVDVKSNKDSFTGRPIESMGMERLSPSLRYHSGTSDPAKWVSNSLESTVGEAFGKDSMLVASPVQVDYLVRNYFGWLGERAVSVVDTVSSKAKGENEPHKDWSEYQPMRRFYRDLSKPGYTKQQTEFYEDLKEVNRIYSDIKKLRELGKDEQALELLDESRDRLKYRKIMNRVQRQLSQINSRMKMIERQNIDSEIKRKRMDVLRERKIKLVKMVDSRIN